MGAGTPDEEGSEAEGAPSSSSGRRTGSGARRAKRPRLVWTMELNKRFLDAVMHLVRHAQGSSSRRCTVQASFCAWACFCSTCCASALCWLLGHRCCMTFLA